MHGEVIELTDLAKCKRSQFGEFLVQHRVIDRSQLFLAPQMQDRVPGTLIGQCAAALGFVPRSEVEQLHLRFVQTAPTINADLETMETSAFHREPEIEIVVD